MIWIWSLPIAFALDLLLGDPPWLPHPVRWIGAWIHFCEPRIRKLLGSTVFSGVIFWFCIVLPCLIIPWVILYYAQYVHVWLARILETWMIYQGIALRDLRHEVQKIYRHLQRKDLPSARQACSRIVSRSTDGMDEAALSRSAIESAAENGIDGVISPLFWTAFCGPIGLWAFKAASTLDSMVGYRTPEYEKFGKFSARVDDLLNWIPGRLAILFYSLSAFPHIPQILRTLKISLRDHHLHASPNSGWGEAAAAGFIGSRLGGPAVYHGQRKEKPWFGEEFRDTQKEDIPLALKMVLRACAIFLLLIVLSLFHVYA